MRHSRLGVHYNILVTERRRIRKYLRLSIKYRRELYNILERILKLERQHNIRSDIKTEVLASLNQVCQDIVTLEDEDNNLTFNLDRLPLG